MEIDAKQTFSSPIVNLPCVSLFCSQKASSFLTGSVWRTLVRKRALDLVYSWPGCPEKVRKCTCRWEKVGRNDSMRNGWEYAYVDFRVIRQRSQCLVQGFMHLLWRTLEESSAPYACHIRQSVCLGYPIPHHLPFCSSLPTKPELPTSNEERISCEHSFLLPILHVPANAILCMARRV